VLSRREILGHEQVKDPSAALLYKMLPADPKPDEPARMGWERPILHARIDAGDGRTLHVPNVHLKFKRPTDVDGQSKCVPGLTPTAGRRPQDGPRASSSRP
jgi:hypothetical protein